MRGGVFVCHASQDAGIAHRIVAALEAGGVPCWLAPRDIDPGENYTQAILDGLAAAPAVVLVFSAATNASPHVTRELETVVTAGTPIVPVRLEDVDPSPSLRYFIGDAHWLDTVGATSELWEPPLVRAVRRTVEQRGGVVEPESPPQSVAPRPVTAPPPAPPPATTPPGRGRMVLVGALSAAAAVAAVIVGVAVLSEDDDPSDNRSAIDTDSESSPPAEVTCWDGSTARDQAGCPLPTGREGLASVFPSLTPDCAAPVPQVQEKAEIFECDRGGYVIRFTRWTEGYDTFAYYDAENGIAGVEWGIAEEPAGRQWTSFETNPEETLPYQWSACYRDFPFSLSVEGATATDRREGIMALTLTPPSRIGLAGNPTGG